jgi:hypothetical protein
MRHAAGVAVLVGLLSVGCAQLSSVTANRPVTTLTVVPSAPPSGTRDDSGMHVPRSPAPRQPW